MHSRTDDGCRRQPTENAGACKSDNGCIVTSRGRI